MDSSISRRGSLRVVVVADDKAVGEVASRFVATRVRRHPSLALALPTGKTPRTMYRALVKAYRGGAVDFSRAHVFNLDEVCGLSPLDPASYAAYLRREFLSRTNIQPRRVRLLNGLAPDPNAECRRHEASIRSVGGLDLAVLGIGRNGHIAFNEPGSPLNSRTRMVELTPETIADNNFGRVLGVDGLGIRQAGSVRGAALSLQSQNQRADVPPSSPLRREPICQDCSNKRVDSRLSGDDGCVCALTIGIETILEAHEVILLASGIRKAGILARALRGPVTAAVPASALQRHPRVTAILDREAARELDLDEKPRRRQERGVRRCTKTS